VSGRGRVARRAAAARAVVGPAGFVLAGVVLATAAGPVGCAGPPFYMGQPLDGTPSIPATTKAPSVPARRTAAAAARAAGQVVLELRALLALDDADRLQPPERARLVELLDRRAGELAEMERAVPAAGDLRRLARLDPARGVALRARAAVAERGAGDLWLAVGDRARAREAYERAHVLGAEAMEARLLAASGRTPPPELPDAALAAAVAELPARALPPFAAAYVARGGREPALLARALGAARDARDTALAARIAAELPVDEAPGAAPTPVSTPGLVLASAAAPDAVAAASRPSTPSPAPAPAVAPPAGPATAPPPVDLDAWVLGSPSLSYRLLPLLRRRPDLLAAGPRSRRWADLLLDEDPTSPDVLEAAALIDGLAGRLGGAERKLGDLVYFSPDRYAGMIRAARVWERAGEARAGCALWIRAARWRDDPEDPAWRRAVACTRRDPAAGDWRAIRQYVLDRAPAARRAALAAALDGA
jgi:hypothetical protein